MKDYYIKSLQDGRNVWLYGQKVDVTTDKHFAGTLSTISNLFTLFDDPIRRDSVDMLVQNERICPYSLFSSEFL